jgi:hypothetical protein
MSITRIDNIFSQEEIDHIDSLALENPAIDTNLGRIHGGQPGLLPDTRKRLTDIARSLSGLPLGMEHAMIVEYSNLYGKPNLPPHFDGDTNDLIINIQLKSNTVWEMGLNTEVHTLNDNSALVFNANKEVHWRVHKEFQDGEYVRMMFVRFHNEEKRSDYSYQRLSQDDPIFRDAVILRDSLR